MKVLSLWQPWCSLCVVIDPRTGEPYKTIETRGWKPPKSLIGQTIALHAAKRRPPVGLIVGEWRVGVEPLYRGNPMMFTLEQDGHTPLPLGAIVATCTLVDVVPMVDGACGPGHAVLQVHPDCLLGDDPFYDPRIHRNFTDQRPYGDFTAGRFAWLLSDVKPVDPPVPFKGGQGLARSWEPSDG